MNNINKNTDNFDWKFYLDRYPDLTKNGLKNEKGARWHYLNYGIKEKRAPNAEGDTPTKGDKVATLPVATLTPSTPYLSEARGVRGVSVASAPPINILMRNTYRPTQFKKCIESILSQNYENYKVWMCYDDDNCLEYLNEYMNHEKIEISFES